MKKPTFLLFLIFCAFTIQAQEINNNAIKFIKEYYSGFRTSYDFDGKYIVISENYKATFSDAIFTLTFEAFDENKTIQQQTITINLKDVLGIEPYGTDVIEIIDNDPLIVPICGKLAFITAKETYNINIYYEVDDDVEQSEIYKAFEKLIKIKPYLFLKLKS